MPTTDHYNIHILYIWQRMNKSLCGRHRKFSKLKFTMICISNSLCLSFYFPSPSPAVLLQSWCLFYRLRVRILHLSFCWNTHKSWIILSRTYTQIHTGRHTHKADNYWDLSLCLSDLCPDKFAWLCCVCFKYFRKLSTFG